MIEHGIGTREDRIDKEYRFDTDEGSAPLAWWRRHDAYGAR